MTNLPTPYRQIRALQTETTITVYQAYSAAIALPAVEQQKLNASPNFSTTRMTWIKPSWAWMLYRSGYSYKDPGQECILALTMTKEALLNLLRQSLVNEHISSLKEGDDLASPPAVAPCVRVQWDPERTVRLQKLGYRSIQIGVPGALVDRLVEGIVKIEDVTARARALKRVLDDDEDLDEASLKTMCLVPEENIFELDEELLISLRMQHGRTVRAIE
ncbi:hypothetical protein ACN47E_005678 [Coniothyrium glycines]